MLFLTNATAMEVMLRDAQQCTQNLFEPLRHALSHCEGPVERFEKKTEHAVHSYAAGTQCAGDIFYLDQKF